MVYILGILYFLIVCSIDRLEYLCEVCHKGTYKYFLIWSKDIPRYYQFHTKYGHAVTLGCHECYEDFKNHE